MGCKDVQYCGQREVENEIDFIDVIGDDQPMSSSFVVLHVVAFLIPIVQWEFSREACVSD